MTFSFELNLEGFFAYIHATWRHVRSYGPKWLNLTSSGCQILILRVRRPKWHLWTSSRVAGVFTSIWNATLFGTAHDWKAVERRSTRHRGQSRASSRCSTGSGLMSRRTAVRRRGRVGAESGLKYRGGLFTDASIFY